MEKNEKLLFAKILLAFSLLLFGILLNTFVALCYIFTIPLGLVAMYIMFKAYRQLRKLYIDED